MKEYVKLTHYLQAFTAIAKITAGAPPFPGGVDSEMTMNCYTGISYNK